MNDITSAACALVLGYAFSSAIQLFVKPAEAADRLGQGTVREVGLAAGLGFISSPCSFAALAATRALWTKGARSESVLAFMFASTNLVIEVGWCCGSSWGGSSPSRCTWAVPSWSR